MPPNMRNINGQSLNTRTSQVIRDLFSKLDYAVLGDMYCEEGGEAFWNAHRKKCQTMGLKIAETLKQRLLPKRKKPLRGSRGG